VRLPTISDTLFGRTAKAFTLAFIIFSLFSLGLVVYFVTSPLTQRVANDLSALAVLTAQIWVELPPETRPDFEREMREHHEIMIAVAKRKLVPDPSPPGYLLDFQQAMKERTGRWHEILYDANEPHFRWVDVPMGGRLMRVGFDIRRFITRIPLTLILMVAAGTLIAIVTSLVMVRRVTQPLAALAHASTQIGQGKRGEPLPEEGATELVELTRNFNQMEQQLDILLKNRTTLLAGISHDLRTPIARMQLELELLDDKASGELIDGLRADLDEMNEIISSTLQLSKGGADEITKQVELCGLIESLLKTPSFIEADIAFRCAEAIYRDLPVTAFRRVLNNLIDNAVRYGRGRPVKVNCRHEGRQVQIEVIDQGPGIPKDQREMVLQPFNRLEESRNRTSGGSGLGLAIVDQLCQLNGWRFELDEGDRGGAIARLYLT
jgi:two-component system osmolarity sensor histidine kinase EnvZ